MCAGYGVAALPGGGVLATLADVVAVGGGHLLRLVAGQFDAAPQIGCNRRLIAPLS